MKVVLFSFIDIYSIDQALIQLVNFRLIHVNVGGCHVVYLVAQAHFG